MTKKEREEQQAQMAEARKKREEDKQRRQQKVAEQAKEAWPQLEPATADHPYLKSKGVKAHGLRVDEDGLLVVPMYTLDNALWSYQTISESGDKQFPFGGRVTGCCYPIGKIGTTIYVAEGVATGASIFEATGAGVVCAFNCNNLDPVARSIRDKYPEARIVLCADNDEKTEGNPGVSKAEEVADIVGAVVAAPAVAGDWNDVHQQHGLYAVEVGIAAAVDKASDEGVKSLDATRDFISRFCAFPSRHELNAVTLWAAHAHMVLNFHTTPRLSMLSPEPESGKTRVLEVLDLLTPEAQLQLSPSPATVFRTLADRQITLLFDEVDAVFKGKARDEQHEDLRALLNSGYRKSATIPRCVGPNHEVVNFPVFAAVALAGLGNLPDTIMTRSIIIRMRRRAPNEKVESFRHRIHEPQGKKLRERLSAWCKQVAGAAGAAWPSLPEGVEDRSAECWEPLIAVADEAGGHWPETARDSCKALVSAATDQKVSLRVRLLSDVRTIFGDADAMHSAELLRRLKDSEEYGLDDDAPWDDLYGKGISKRQLASMLGEFEIRPQKVRVDGKVLQGYRREKLWDAWERYLPPLHPEKSGTSGTPGTNAATTGPPGVPDAFRTENDPEREVEHQTPATAGPVTNVPDVPDNPGGEGAPDPRPTTSEVAKIAQSVKAEHGLSVDVNEFASWLVSQGDPEYCIPAGVRAWMLKVNKDGYPE